MRFHKVYKLIDPRYQEEDPRRVRYIGRTSEKLSALLDTLSTAWRKDGGPKWKWLQEMSRAKVDPGIIVIEKVDSAWDAKESEAHWIDHYEALGYQLVNVEGDQYNRAWNRQRVVEDFQIEVMRLLLGQDSPYDAAIKKLSEKGKGSALLLYLQAAETPNLSVEEIPDLFRERDERVRGLEHRVVVAIEAGKIREPIMSALREAIEEGKRSIPEEEGSAIERYVEMVAAATLAKEKE